MFKNLKQRLITDWSWMRVIRLGLAIVFIIQAWTNHEILFAILGGVVLFQAVFNYGCCGTSGCNVNNTDAKSNTLNDNQNTITYTEIK